EGSRESILKMMRFSGSGHDGGRTSGGALERMRRSRCSLLDSSKGSRPAIIWYSRTPTDHRSECESMLCVSSRSGEQYAVLAKIFTVYLRVCESALAIPKSRTFTRPSDVRRMFFGLRSP